MKFSVYFLEQVKVLKGRLSIVYNEVSDFRFAEIYVLLFYRRMSFRETVP